MNKHPATLKPYVVGEVRILNLLKEAVVKSFSLAYFEAMGMWLFILISLHLMKAYIPAHSSGLYDFFLGFFEMFVVPSAIAVAWYRHLGYGEKIPFLRFSKKELNYAWMWLLFVCLLVFILFLVTLIGIIGYLAPLGLLNLENFESFFENSSPESIFSLMAYGGIYLSAICITCFYVIYRIAIWLALKVLDLPGVLAGSIIAPFKLEIIVLFFIYCLVSFIISSIVPSEGVLRTLIHQLFFVFLLGADMSFIFLLIKARVDFSVPSESNI